MNDIPHYCQNCGKSNTLGEQTCRNCGTRLMIVVFPPAIRHDESVVPSYYEDHLLERVTLLENRLSLVMERLAFGLDLMSRQTKKSHSDHILIETLIDSLNAIGAIEKESLLKNWKKKTENEEKNKTSVDRLEKIFGEILTHKENPKVGLFSNLIIEGMKYLLENEEKQAFRVLERSSKLAPQNDDLLIFLAECSFKNDKFDEAINYIEKALEINPKKEKAIFLLAVVYADINEVEKSRQLLQSLKKENKNSFVVNYILAFCAASQESWLEVLEHFKKFDKDFHLPETNYLLGCGYFQISKYKVSLGFIKKAVEADANFADAWFMLSVIYTHLGDETKALQAKELAWSVGEPGAQCLEFLKNRNQSILEIALPFLRLKNLKRHLVTGGSLRFSKLIREEIFKTLDNLK